MKIEVSETEGVRLLKFGTRWCQGAMRIAEPDRLELEYAARMSAWLLFHDHESLAGKHLVTLGLGAASLTKFAYRVLGMRATAVEIDPRVIAICREHFMLPADGERLEVVLGDGAAFVANPANANSIDVLQVDAYDASVQKPALDSESFYADCAASLREGGTLCVNLIGRELDVRASVARIRENVRPRAVWQFPPTEAGNVIVIAHRGEVPNEELLLARARQVVRRWSLPAPGWMAMARRAA